MTGREADYAGAGFAGTLGFGSRPALIVVDLMMAYFDPASPMYAGVEPVLGQCVALIDLAVRHRVPVILTRQVFDGDEGDMYVRKVPALRMLGPRSPLAELHPAVRDRGELVVKHYPSAFHRTPLLARLGELGVDTPLVTGLTTSGCIRATMMDCLLADLHGVVVQDAVGDRDPGAHEANLFDIRNKLADVAHSTVVAQWICERGASQGSR